MSNASDSFQIDGREVEFTELGDGHLKVQADGVDIGELAPVEARAFHAIDWAGERLTQPSPWGGAISTKFGTRELAARALLERRFPTGS